MKTKAIICILVLTTLLCAGQKHNEKLVLTFFGSPTCEECMTIKGALLNPLLKQHEQTLEIHFRNTEEAKDFTLLTSMEKGYHVTSPSPQELFFPDTVLLGFDNIMKNGRALIEAYVATPEKWNYRHAYGDSTIDTSALNSSLQERIGNFSFIGLLAAGILDGINPCAIATMIFLVSFLATKKRSRRQIFIVGMCFTGAVFVTYLLLGVGAFKVITMLDQYRWISLVIRWSAAAFAFIVGALSCIDAFRFRKTHKSGDIMLQLPNPIKLRIHKIISGNLTGTQLVTGALITGFLVTLLEAVCTGQVYLPTIILMTKQYGFRLTGWLYLIFYNFLFVLPLLIVMISAAYGMKWNKLAKLTQNNLTLTKLLMALVLFALAAFIIIAK